MDTILMNSENSNISDAHRLQWNLPKADTVKSRHLYKVDSGAWNRWILG